MCAAFDRAGAAARWEIGLRRNVAYAFALAWLVLGGCSSVPEAREVDAFDDELTAAAEAQKTPLHVFSVAVAPPVISGAVATASAQAMATDPAATAPESDTTTATLVVPPPHGQEKFVGARPVDRAALGARFTTDVDRLKLFRRVEGLPQLDLPDDLAGQRRTLAAAARELRTDLVLIPRVKVHEVAYVGMTGW